eukprot:EG_transcript_7890
MSNRERTPSQPIRPVLRATDTESSILMYDEWSGPKPGWQAPEVQATLYWSLFYLSFVGIWAYQSLLSAQAYYSLHFPSAGLTYWGTVSVGAALCVTHCLQVLLRADYHCGYNARVVPALLGFVAVALLVVLWREASVIIVAFALVGVFSSLSQTPLYGLAGLFATGSFTQAMSAGNGLAGVLTITVETLVRAVVVHTGLGRETAHLVAFIVFMSILVVLGMASVLVYLRLIRVPAVQLAIADASLTSQGPSTGTLCSIARGLWLPATTEFLVLFVSLAVWPGLPCSAHLTGWFAAHPEWFCAPVVISAYNFADLFGRGLAGLPFFADLSLHMCGALALLRCLFIPLVASLAHSQSPHTDWLVTAAVFAVGLSNGLLATVAMMRGPQLFETTGDRRTAAAVMTAAMFGGIACGSILPVLLRP